MYPEALVRFEQALSLFKSANADGESVHEAATMHKIGVVLSLLGRLPEAFEILSLAHGIQKRSLGFMDRDVAATLDSLGNVLGQMHRKEEALSRHKEALKIHQWHRVGRVLAPGALPPLTPPSHPSSIYLCLHRPCATCTALRQTSLSSARSLKRA
mmetsp:Transcript_5120/g.11872  ORF Transcript_5120/g.11872 Transcript_5120/m.11872 type:complete len:156 (+) Transcript_5120:562-1029(+)